VRSVVYCIVYWHFSIGSVWVYLSALIVGLVAWQAWLALCSALHRRPSLFSLTHTHLSSVLFSSLRISSLLSSILADDLFVALFFFHAISVCSLTYSLHFVHCPLRVFLHELLSSSFGAVHSVQCCPYSFNPSPFACCCFSIVLSLLLRSARIYALCALLAHLFDGCSAGLTKRSTSLPISADDGALLHRCWSWQCRQLRISFRCLECLLAIKIPALEGRSNFDSLKANAIKLSLY